MNTQLDKLERELEVEWQRLGPVLTTEHPADALVTRVQDAARAEARRLYRARRLRRAAGSLSAAAAAIVMIVGVYVPGPRDPLAEGYAASDPEVLYEDWLEAGAESDVRFTMLLDESTTEWGTNGPGSYDTELEDSLEVFEETFEVFERILGT